MFVSFVLFFFVFFFSSRKKSVPIIFTLLSLLLHPSRNSDLGRISLHAPLSPLSFPTSARALHSYRAAGSALRSLGVEFECACCAICGLFCELLCRRPYVLWGCSTALCYVLILGVALFPHFFTPAPRIRPYQVHRINCPLVSCLGRNGLIHTAGCGLGYQYELPPFLSSTQLP